MKLRSPLRIQQLLSLWGAAFLLVSTAIAQIDATLTMQDNTRRATKVIGMLPSGASLQIVTPDGTGTLALPVSQIKDVSMVQPPDLNLAITAFQKKDYSAALVTLKKVTDKYKGMPAQWAMQATSLLPNIYLAKGDIPTAEAALREFQRLYPTQGGLQVDVTTAMISIARKDFESAKPKLALAAEQALKDKNVSNANALAYSQTFLALGQIEESEGKFQQALEDYLRTVTLFYHDRAAAALAQEKADALRKTHKGLAVP